MEDANSESGSGRHGTELAEHAADGEPSQTHRLVSDTGAEEAGVSTTEDTAVQSDDRDVRDDAGEETVGSDNLNWNRAWDQRDLQPRNQDLQSTLKLGDAVEDDARAVARSLTALLGSLKSALSEVYRYREFEAQRDLSQVTGSSLEHMRTENEAAGQVQDSAIDAATKGNRFINGCLRLNEEMKGMNILAAQLESLKQRVDQFEYQSNRYLPRQ